MKKILICCSVFCITVVAHAQEKKMPTIKTEINLIPDSIVIETKDDTSYIIVTNGNGFMTKNPALFRKIVNWMTNDAPNDNKDNYVIIEGTLVGSLSKFYRSEFKESDDADDAEKKKLKSAKKRALELNGRLYRLTGHKIDSRLKNGTQTMQPSPVPPPTDTTAATTPKSWL